MDERTAQKLILLCHGRLLRLASRKIPSSLRPKVGPEDILQQVYLDAMVRIGDFEPRDRGAFFRWLVRILESKLVDCRRFYGAGIRDAGREAPRAETPSGFERLIARSAMDTATPSRILARKEKEAFFWAAMAGLSPDHRRVLELRFLQDLPVAEVARRLGRSVPAAQMLCVRALRELRKSARAFTASLREPRA